MRYIILLLLISNLSFAQEIKCDVEINTSALKSSQNSDPQVIAELKSAISNFMNNQRWTNDIFGEKEKIKCKLSVNLMSSPKQNVFQGNAQFQVVRPVYGTDYETVVFQYIDNSFNISFEPSERQMVFNEQGYTNNLTSILAFYSLMALTFDYDSFAKLGGNDFVQRAYNIVNLASSGDEGWAQKGSSRNRYWLVENLQNQQLRRFREGFYSYHRLVLDDFGRDQEKARGEVLKFLEVVQNIMVLQTTSVLVNTFFDAKALEIVNIFSQGSPQEKQKAFLLLSTLDPDKTEVYRKIVI
ncbi:protein of unknown function [Spirosomataceae bacterium TFI 002]|nr:protein of unknown function [Spirosomataceae bacterium TFI 002]